MATVKHTHQYMKRLDGLWMCSGIDGCTHFMPKNMAPSPVGLMSVCWDAKIEKGDRHTFRLTPYNMRHAQPRCDDCQNAMDKFLRVMEGKALDEEDDDPIVTAYNLLKAEEAKKRAKQTVSEPEPDQIEVIEPDEDI